MAKRPAARAATPPDHSTLGTLPGEGVRDVKTELDRIVFFSDAVFAIAITLLALNIHIPQFAAEPSDAMLWQAVATLLPQFLIYALSFLVVGVFWVSHHRSFRAIRRYDLALIWLNLFQLLFIAFLPVSSSLLGYYPYHQPTVVLYSLNVIAAGITQFLTWDHATRNHHLVDADLDERLFRYVRLNSLGSILAFVLTIIVSIFDARIALVIPILVLILYVPLSAVLQKLLLRLVMRG